RRELSGRLSKALKGRIRSAARHRASDAFAASANPDDIRPPGFMPFTMECTMVGRKLSTVALVGSLAVVAIVGGCRDAASTGPSGTPSASFASNVRLQQGDVQTG